MRFAKFSILSAALALSACAEQATSETSLLQPVLVSSAGVRPENSLVRLTASRSGGGVSTSSVELRISALDLFISTQKEHATLETFSVPLPDIKIAESLLPPNGVDLRDLRVSIAKPAAADLLTKTETSLAIRAQVPLRLSWALATENNGRYPLADVQTEPLDLSITLEERAEGPVATLTAACGGVCWSVPGVMAMRDVSISLETDATVTPR